MKKFGAWVRDTFLRSLKTAAQSATALVTANTMGLTSVSWPHVGDVAGLAFVVCILHNLSTLQLQGDTTEPALNVQTVQLAAPVPAATFPTAPPAPVVDPADDTPDNTDTADPTATLPTAWVPVPDPVDSVPADQTA